MAHYDWRWRCTILLLSILAAGCGGVSGSGCRPLHEAERARLQRYVQEKYELPDLPELVERPLSNSGCYRALRFTSEGRRSGFNVELYLSPDTRFLSEKLFDSTIDPSEEERRKEQALLAELANGDYPSTGPLSAPVTLTMFSDFQCGYCANAARMLTTEILPRESGKVRLVFRHFPLPNHSWARQAAEAAVCAQTQGEDYFWKLHDFVFEHQREMTPDNLEQKLIGATSGLSGFDQDAFRDCRAGETAKAKVEEDVQFGKWNGVTGTPTLFANAHRLRPGAPPEQIETMIREISGR